MKRDRISKKQQQEEIDFLSKHFCKTVPGQGEIVDYLLHTVHGQKTLMGKFDSNALMQGKTALDRNIKMWREDLVLGLISSKELREDFSSSYFDKLLDTLIDGVDKNYRRQILGKWRMKSTILAYTNFPWVMECLTKSKA